jgi:N-acetylneuraminate synthase
MLQEITLGGRKIGRDQPPLVIAEMSGNHNKSLDRALQIVEAAAQAGAHAMKLQTYTADTMTLDISDGDFFLDDPKSLWKGMSLHELYQQAHTPWEWHQPIFERCRELGMIPFSTPFDSTAVDFLEDFQMPFYKIASFENIDLPLIKKVAQTGKPIIMSTGMATVAELDQAVRTIREEGNDQIILLKCTSSYPASPEATNIRTIPHLRELFDVQVGLSDHTLGIGVALAGIAMGAVVVEKHFTLARADGGVDAAFSLEPSEMRMLVDESLKAWQALGQVHYGQTEKEKRSLIFRRSLYVAEDVKRGEKFTDRNLRVVRPGLGLEPKYYDILMGKTASKDIKRGTRLSWDLIGGSPVESERSGVESE